MRRLFDHARRTGLGSPQVEVIPFDSPKGANVVSNYFVRYEVPTKAGTIYKGGFSVYILSSGGRTAYAVKEPYLDPDLSAAVSSALESLSNWLAPSPIVDLDPIGYLLAELARAGLVEDATAEDMQSATHYIIRDVLGYGVLDPLLRDPEIEDISCEGQSRPVRVWHRRFNSQGWLDTNVIFRDSGEMDASVLRLVHRSGRSISTVSPIVDAVLPEGFRLAATWGREVTSQGSSFTIRKQRAEPFTIPDLVRAGTLDPAMAAYLWLMLDLRGFVMVSGVTASGKTTLLNSLAGMLNPAWKIVSIEDTREISLPHAGWKPLHTRSSVGGSNIGLFDLVKLSLRERPDFVILGEARGGEVQALFQSAAAGSGCITTFHSSNLESMTARLTQPPLSVSPSLLQLIDAAVFMAKSPDGGGRWVGEVLEMGEHPSAIFRRQGSVWEGSADLSNRLPARAEAYGFGARRYKAELERRVDFITSALGKGGARQRELSDELSRFYLSSSATL